MPILALEGASGSGKSTLVKHLSERNSDWIVPPQWSFPRERSRELEIWGNSVMDYQTVMAAITYPDRIILADRFMLGHYVYANLKYEPMFDWAQSIQSSYESLVETANHQLGYRDPHTDTYMYYPVALILNIECDAVTLKKRRCASGKHYPFQERELYATMARQFKQSKQLRLSRISSEMASVEYIESVANEWLIHL